MYQSERINQSWPQATGETPAWERITRELIDSLKADWVELKGNRMKLSGVVAQTREGDCVTDLQVIALTPLGQEIVKYKLSPRPSGQVAFDLAALISSAQFEDTPVETLVTSIAERVMTEDGYQFVHNIHPMNLHQATPMQRVIPSFSAFIRNPITMDREFRTEKLVGDTRIRARSRLYPEFKECVIEAHSYNHNSSADQGSFAFKRRCNDSFFKETKSTQEITAELLRLSWETFEVITSDGPAEAYRQFYSADLDDRLSHGVINPLTAEKNLQLPSGARVRMEIGDTVACITTQALPSDESATFSWMILAKNGALDPFDSRLITARVAVEKLALGGTSEKLEAIAALDRMAHKAPTKVASLESVIGYEVADFLRELNHAVVRMGEPRSEARMLDNLAGMQHVELLFKDPGHNRKRPQDPYYMSLGFGCDGDLKIEAWNSLGNHTSAYVSGINADRHGGLEKVTMRLAQLFDRQTAAGFMQLRATIEDLESSVGTDRIARERFPAQAWSMPSTRDIPGCKSYEIVAELAKMYQAATGASFSELKVARRSEDVYDIEFCNVIGRKKSALHCFVTQHGINRFELMHDNSGTIEAESFQFETPLTVTSNQADISGIFGDFNTIMPADEDVASASLPSITSTPLFTRLKGLEEDTAAVE